MEKKSKILIVGHRDILQTSLRNYFLGRGFSRVLVSSEIGLDVLSQSAVHYFFDKERPEYVFLAPTHSGGIGANQKHGAEFIFGNLESQNNIIHAAYTYGVKKLMFFAGSCVYPKECFSPIKEEYLLTGPVEKTSEPYTIAKIAGIKLCQTYKKQYDFPAIVVIPATVYGPGAEEDLEDAHVMGALIGKFYEAVKNNQNKIILWGTGKPRREFLYSDDFVSACLLLMEHDGVPEMINAGNGKDISIRELAALIQEISGFKGKIVFDPSKPDGTMNKVMDNSRILQMGWKPQVDLREGIESTYQWYKNHQMKEK